jgi:hypothetical protein
VALDHAPLGLWVSFLVFTLRILLRRAWAVAIVIILTSIALSAVFEPSLFSSIPMLLMIAGLLTIFPFGLLGLVTYILFINLFLLFPITTQLSAWYSGIGLTGLALLLAFALYAFHTSLGSQPMFGRASLED